MTIIYLSYSERTPEKNRILDLYITNRLTLFKYICTVPSISDHDGAIVADSDIIPTYNKKTQRKYFVSAHAKWTKIKQDVVTFTEEFLISYMDNSVNDNLINIKDCINTFTGTRSISFDLGKTTQPMDLERTEVQDQEEAPLIQESQGFWWSGPVTEVPWYEEK